MLLKELYLNYCIDMVEKRWWIFAKNKKNLVDMMIAMQKERKNRHKNKSVGNDF